VLYAVVALYYYLKVANAMYMRKPLSAEPVASTPAMNVALYFSAAATVIIGLFPNVFIQAVNWSVSVLGPGGIAQLK
jgi:NADH-quinone oxidoreductase subunit N